MNRRLCLAAGFVAVWLLGGAAFTASQETEQGSVANRMQGIFKSLQSAFLVSLDPEAFQAPANRGMILDALDGITADAAQLAAHEDGSASFMVLSRSLADDADRTLSLFADGDTEGARFHLSFLVNRCFACHSRLPAADGGDLGREFMQDPRVATLSLRDQMTVAVAARQFTRAMDIGERILASKDLSSAAIDMTGTMEEYLKVALRVRSDYERPIATLGEFRRRPDIPAYLATYVDAWLESLQSIETNLQGTDGLALARTLIQHGRIKNLYPADRRGLVYFLVASSLLHQFVELNGSDPGRTAEAFYHLGVIDETISSSLWTSETELYLEQAIRLAPGTPLAGQAYRFLEEYMLSGYTGSAGLMVPPEVQAQLDTLKTLAEPE